MALSDDIQKLYVAYFSRPADVPGLAYWMNEANSSGGDTSDIANAFGVSTEYSVRYAGLSSSDLIDAVYENLFNRDAESEGKSYWIGQLDKGALSIGNIVLAILNGAQSGDADAVAAKEAAATVFTQSLLTTAQINSYSGSTAILIAQNWLASVSDWASLIPAYSSLPQVIASLSPVTTPPPALTPHVFTSGTDNFTTTDGTLIYTATLGSAATLNINDSLHGAGNTLAITDASGATSYDVLPTGLSLTGVPFISLTTTGNAGLNAGSTFDVSSFTDVTRLDIDSSGSHGDFISVGAGVALTVREQGGNARLLVNGDFASLAITSNSLTELYLSGNAGTVSLTDPSGPTELTVNVSDLTTTGITDSSNHITNLIFSGDSAAPSVIKAITDAALSSLTLSDGVTLGTAGQSLILGSAITSVSGANDNADSYITLSAANAVVALGSGNNVVEDAATTGTNSLTLGNGNNSFIDSGAGRSLITFGTGYNTADLGGYSNDVIGIGTDGGYANSPTAPNLIVNHAAAGDNITLLSISGHFQTQYLVGALGTHGTVAGTIANLESLLAANSTAQSFALDKFGGDTFIVTSASGTLGATDTTVIQLVGYTGNVTWSGSDNVLHLT